ncbi:DinB family protein [Anaerolineales bacterium HSG6]|nr:DinB family protein [Anaerolineales bacterium HSG6]
MIQDTESFIRYFDGIRRRTMKFVQAIPATQINWSSQPNEYTCGDIVRHLAATELMFVQAVLVGSWDYAGHEQTIANSLEETVSLLESNHTEAMNRLGQLKNSELYRPRPTLNGPSVKAWRLLMAMVEHEIHHRSQLATYLTLMGVESEQIFGLGIEEVIGLTEQKNVDSSQ